MKRSVIKFIVLTLLLPVILLSWLMTTQSGLHLAYQQLKTYLPGAINISLLEGNLLGPITMKAIQYQQDGMLISAEKIIVDWQLSALLDTTVDINRLQIQTLRIVLPLTEKSEQPLRLPDIHFPWRVTLKNTVINQLDLIQDEQAYHVKQIRLGARALLSQLDIDELSIQADDVKLNISGALQLAENYPHDLNIQWQFALPSAAVIQGNGQLHGDSNMSRINQQLAGAVQATLTAELNRPLDQFSWQMHMDVDQFDLAKLDPDWPALTGKVKLHGHGDLSNAMVAGTWKGHYQELNQPLDAEFELGLDWQHQHLNISQLNLHSGDTRFNLQGQLAETLKLNWSLLAPDLSQLYPEAEGDVRASGQLTGAIQTPTIEASFNGKALSLPDYKIASIQGAIAVDPFRWQQINIKLAAQTLSYKNMSLRSLNIDTDTRHLKARIISDALSASIELKGDVDGNGWQGQLVRADLQSQHLASWKLKAPVAISLTEKILLAETLCWHNQQQASICARVRQENNTWQSDFELQQLSLLVLSPWLPADLKLEGVVDGTAKLELLSPDQLLGQVNIQLPAGILSYPLLAGERNQWAYDSASLTINLNEQGLKAHANMAIAHGDELTLTAELPQAQLLALDPEQQKLVAEAKLTIHDLGLIEALLPEVQNLQGEITLNASVSGTLAQPRLNGQAHLNKGEFQIPRLGLSISQLTIRGQNEGSDKIKMRLDARSGDGKLVIEGQTLLDSAAGWPSEFSIRGHQFEVSRIPEARVLVSPDLQLKLRDHRININGNIDIPYAKLQPRDITSAVHVSDDAHIINAETPSAQKWLIITRIRLTLGERVTYFGYGFEGKFGGSLLLEDEPGQLTRATGEFNVVEGRYRAYGQRLDVEQGRLLYTGGPLDNPGLDLRAVRHINNVTAGLKVKGSLSQPQLELFTIPSMGQTDALSYLLLGRPMETASGEEGAMVAKAALALGLSGGDRLARLLGDRFGLDEMRIESSDTGEQASLVVGRYLSPKIYISYGVGLIEAINTFTVRYQISDKWQLKAESGEHQGADFLYTIER